MNLISCKNCGVVLNVRYLNFPDDPYHRDGEVAEHAVWTGERFTTSVHCPVCNELILKPEES